MMRRVEGFGMVNWRKPSWVQAASEFMRRDVIFVHAPSLFDFRKLPIFLSPISDIVPSTSIFEMYPIGITSIADHLERHGYHVQIVNLAYRMLEDPGYDPARHIQSMNPRL